MTINNLNTIIDKSEIHINNILTGGIEISFVISTLGSTDFFEMFAGVNGGIVLELLVLATLLVSPKFKSSTTLNSLRIVQYIFHSLANAQYALDNTS